MKYGFIIDLKRCFGCYTCQVACKAEHFTPPDVSWGRCLKGETGKYPTTIRQALPILCMQCKEPECMKVCPTKATTQRPDGIITVDKNLCVGCRYCMVACPYGSRYFTLKWSSYFSEDKLPSPIDDDVRRLFPGIKTLSPFEEYAKRQWIEKYGEGTATKCNFCIERVEKGQKPSCVETCPAKARYFGDLDDPESEVATLLKTQRGFQLNPEFGTDPSVYYLPPR